MNTKNAKKLLVLSLLVGGLISTSINAMNRRCQGQRAQCPQQGQQQRQRGQGHNPHHHHQHHAHPMVRTAASNGKVVAGVLWVFENNNYVQYVKINEACTGHRHGHHGHGHHHEHHGHHHHPHERHPRYRYDANGVKADGIVEVYENGVCVVYKRK